MLSSGLDTAGVIMTSRKLLLPGQNLPEPGPLKRNRLSEMKQGFVELCSFLLSRWYGWILGKGQSLPSILFPLVSPPRSSG